MKALITGGAGFIGSHTADELLKAGYDVVILDNLDPKIHPGGQPSYLPDGVEFIHGDVRDKSVVEKALRDIEVVFHFAAYQDYMSDFSTFFHVNSVGTALLYEVIVEKGLDLKRIVVASSQAVYGEGAFRCHEHGVQFPDMRPASQLEAGRWEPACPSCGEEMIVIWAEEEQSNPQNQYAMSKLTQELIAVNLGRRYGIPTVALRYSIVQGPRQSFFNLYSGICRIFCLNAIKGYPSIVYEDGQQLRDYVNIEDVVRANLLVIGNDKAAGQVFNVGGGRGHTVLDFAEVVSSALQKEIQIKIPGKFRFGDTRHILSSTKKLKRLGWCPVNSPRKSVEDYLRWIGELEEIPEASAHILEEMEETGVIRGTRKTGGAILSSHAGNTIRSTASGRKTKR